MKSTPKMLAAREAQRRRLEEHVGTAEALRQVRADCVTKMDRLQLLCAKDPRPLLATVPFLRSVRSHQLRAPKNGAFQAYGRTHWFEHRHSGMKVNVEFDRQKGYLSPFRLTLYADDWMGLVPDEVSEILDGQENFKTTLIEIAFDFQSGVNRSFLRSHALFGRSKPQPSHEHIEHFGARTYKLVRAYYKPGISAFRVEVEVHSRFLRQHRIGNTHSFRELVGLLPGRHILFARLNPQKLSSRLHSMGFSIKRRNEIVRTVEGMKSDLWAALHYLRREVRMANTRRLLEPLDTNQVVRESLRTWAERWPLIPLTLVTS